MCKFCEHTDVILSGNYKNIGYDLRLDVEYDIPQLDVRIGFVNETNEFIDDEWTGVLNIKYCPMCGRNLINDNKDGILK